MEAQAEASSPLRFSHNGETGELFAITLANLLLKVVTLGVYHFWGKTRVRRYVWGRTQFEGEPFEYTGRGMELFIGYLIAMAVVLPIIGGFQLLPIYAPEYPILVSLAGALFYPLLLFLTGFATFSSRRYLLSRTRWRSIRFGLIGSATRHGTKMLLYSLITAFSFGLYLPFLRNNLMAHLVNNTWFGDRRLTYEGRGADLLLRFVALWFICGGIFLAIILIIAVGAGVMYRLNQGEPPGGAFPAVFVGLGILIWVGFALAWVWYSAGEKRYFVDKTRLGDVRLSFNATTPKLMWLIVSNLLALIFSLGLAYAWVVVRTARFICRNLQMQGELDLDAIAQHPAGLPRTGEGLAEAFDLGSI